MNGWHCSQITHGSRDNRFHSHSYYDIPVFDALGQRVIAHRMGMQGRAIGPDDAVEIGIIDLATSVGFEPFARTSAWSWQQGPLAQWVAGGPRVVFNSRDGQVFRAQVVNTASGAITVLPRTVYAASPDGSVFYGLDMRRLEHLRPGYGYATGEPMPKFEHSPDDNGVWRMEASGACDLIVSIRELCALYLTTATAIERLRHRMAGYIYWLNHLKLSPDGARFTVKLRWRRPRGQWSDRRSVSITGRVDGSDCRVLGQALSHVIWLNNAQLYAWQAPRLVLLNDDDTSAPAPVMPDLVRQNVHFRHLPPGAQAELVEAVFDTPYAETLDLVHYLAGSEAGTASHKRIAHFTGHIPATGPLRCDLHPCPDASGNRIVVTSVEDGGRQVYLLERDPTSKG